MTQPQRLAPLESPPPESAEGGLRLDTVVSVVLRSGVALSAALVTAGLVLMFVRHPGYASLTGSTSYRRLTAPGFPFPHGPGSLLHSLAAGQGRGLAALGLVVLILTPVARVAVSFVSFALSRDRAMTLVTAIVLAALVCSFFLGAASA